MTPRPNVTDSITSAIARFQGWLSRAAPGTTYTYHVGLLGADRLELAPDPSGVVSYRPVEPFDSLAKAVWTSAVAGHVTLWQRRVGPVEYTYLARKTSK